MAIIACFMSVTFDEHITKITIKNSASGEGEEVDFTTSPVNQVAFNSYGTEIVVYFADGYEYDETNINFIPYLEEYTYPTQSWDASTQTLTVTGHSDGSGTVAIKSKAIVQKQTIDVSELSGWANLATGNHQITVKTKASGYADSAASNAVTVSKAASGYTVTFGDGSESGSNNGAAYYSIDNGATYIRFCTINADTSNDYLVTDISGVTQIKFKLEVEAGMPPTRLSLICEKLGVSIGGKSGTFTSDNYTLTEDVAVLISN